MRRWSEELAGSIRVIGGSPSIGRSLSDQLEEDLGFTASVTKPTAATEKELRDVLKRYVLDNDHRAVLQRIDGVLKLLRSKKYERMLSVGNHGTAWRFITASSKEELAKILALTLPEGGTGAFGAGTIAPDEHHELSSWTVNPRSLVYSGFCSVLQAEHHLALVRAAIATPNVFFGNPDTLVAELGLENGYAMEREVIGVGPVAYSDGAFALHSPDRSIEGRAMDLIEKLVPVKSVKWTDTYYFPKLSLR